VTSLTTIGGGLGESPVKSCCGVSAASSVERAEKWFWVVVGCSQWPSSLESLDSLMVFSWRGRLLLLGTFNQGMVDSS
jgi:hypothetical protein